MAAVLSRRDALLSALFGAGYVGLRSLATGLPAALLLDPEAALAAPAAPICPAADRAQFIVFSTSGTGDPINASAPGTYDDPAIVHSPDPAMAPTTLSLGGRPHLAAAPWATLPQSALDRTVFWHLRTGTPVHPKEPEVLRLLGATQGGEMLPSLLARHLAPCLGTIQAQPISVGAYTPAEDLSYGGAAQPVIPPMALKATLASPGGPLGALQPLRDATLDQLSDLYRSRATAAQRRHIDALVTSQQQLRNVNQDLLAALDGITDNGPASQVLAAVTLIRMKVSPVVAIHVPFGGDNHSDPGLAQETAETASGVATLALLLQQLASAGLTDKVTFLSLNVFGRTLGPGSLAGRQHNANHQVSIAIGKPFRGGVIGGVGPLEGDYGALAIDSRSGAGGAGGDIGASDTLAAFGRTMLAAVGADPGVVTGGGIVGAALA